MNNLSYSKQELFDFVKENSFHHLTLVVFTTEWCGACKRMLKTLEELKTESKDVVILQVDAEKSAAPAKDPFFAVSMIPKTFVFRKGVFWKYLEGSADLSVIKKFLDLK